MRAVITLLLLLPLALPSNGLAPVILIPGDGGSQMEARLDGKPQVPHYWCESKTSDFFPIWLNLELLNYFTIDCFTDNFRLVFNPATNISSNAPKVVTRAPAFGDTRSVEYFDASRISPSAYFNTLADALVSTAGYKRNFSLRGAPYDFRRGPNELGNFLNDLKQLIESSVAANGGQPAVLIAHSYGNLLTLRMLQQQSPNWKRRYVRAMLSVSPPFAGAVKSLRLLASGDSLSIPFERPLTIRAVQRTLTSSSFLTPMSPFWSDSEVLASQPQRNYTVADYKQFYEDIGFSIGQQIRSASLSQYDPHTPPGVELHCVHGAGVPTPGQLVWTANFPDAQPKVVNDDGDGTVNIRSLLACQRWRGAQPQAVHNFTILKADHHKILHNKAFINYTLQLLRSFASDSRLRPNWSLQDDHGHLLPDRDDLL